ncbi:hypothetical protein BH10CHL1_BH10CHL1_03310 [soil metagenome]
MVDLLSATKALLVSPLLGNRYHLIDLIGAGGMGSVYRAVDGLTGETVALKRVVDSAMQPTTPAFRLALAHEFQALAGLRHPNVITVRDYGFDREQQPYFTMELLPGAFSIVDAGQWLTLDEKLDLVLQLLAALIYIHRRNIVHRDLKPGNVLVSERTVKVLDFGLATITGQTLPSSGTLAYMAPEILCDQPASPASDLYAVGVIAYELLAGWHPFAHAGQEIRQAILHETPDFTFVEVKPALQLVLQRLLAKQPAERYPDAAAVIGALCAASGQMLPAETMATRESFLQSAPLVGRDAELAQLTTALHAALLGQGSTWLVGGESGIGKSRLLQELRTHALVAGTLVLRGQANSESGGAFALWRDSLRQLILVAQPDDRAAAVLQALVPDIGALVRRPLPAAPPLEPKAAQTRLLVTISDLLRQGAARQPLLFLLEDLQWIDDSSYELLQQLNRLATQLPILVVGSYRHDEYPAVATRLPEMQLLRLPRLAAEQIARLSEAMLGAGGRRPHLVNFLQQETEGNTFFMVEVMRALAEEAGRLDQIVAMNLPLHVFAGGMQQMVQRRLQRVPLIYQPLLQLAAVAGRQLDRIVLQQLAPTLNLEEWLIACANAAVLELPDGALRWQFTHDKLREGCLLTLAETQRQFLHQQTAVTIEQVYAENLTPYYPDLAYHYGQAALRPLERQYLKLAAETAQATFANTAAIEYYERLLTLLTSPVERAEVLLQVGAILKLIGRWNEAEAAYQQALALVEPLDRDAAARAALALGVLQQSRGDFPGALQWLRQAQAHFQPLDNAVQVSTVLVEIANVYFMQGDYRNARRNLEDGLQRAQQQQQQAIVAVALHRLGSVEYAQGQYVDAQHYAEQSLTLYQTLGDKAGMANALNNLGNIARITGNYETAQAHREASLRLRRAIGDIWGIAASLNNLAIIPYLQGNYQVAQQYWEESLRLRNELGDRWAAAQTLDNLGLVAFSQGDYTLACQRHTESLALRRVVGDRPGIAISLSNLAHAELDDGKLAEAHVHYQESLALSQAIEDQRGIISCLIGLAGVMAQISADNIHNLMLAGQMLAAAAQLTEQIGTKLESDEQKLFDQITTIVRTTLSVENVELAWRAVALEATIERAIKVTLAER